MSVQPIDLQNMFLRLNLVGKELAEHRNIIAQQQSVQNSDYLQKEVTRDHQVNETNDLPEGPKKTEEEGSGQQREHEEQGREKKEEEKDKKQTVFQDPDLGHNIDITG
jgi:hypothetical protein